MCDHQPPEPAMVTVCRDEHGHPTVWCDPCIESLVAALNPIPGTLASCCGHFVEDGVITLADGRELVIRPDRTLNLRTVKP